MQLCGAMAIIIVSKVQWVLTEWSLRFRNIFILLCLFNFKTSGLLCPNTIVFKTSVAISVPYIKLQSAAYEQSKNLNDVCNCFIWQMGRCGTVNCLHLYFLVYYSYWEGDKAIPKSSWLSCSSLNMSACSTVVSFLVEIYILMTHITWIILQIEKMLQTKQISLYFYSTWIGLLITLHWTIAFSRTTLCISFLK